MIVVPSDSLDWPPDGPLELDAPPAKRRRKRKNPDNELDFYETPEWATEELVARVQPRGRILEACSGDGAIANVLARSPDVQVFTNDLDRRRPSELHFDAGGGELYRHIDSVDWVITNPPFNDALRILQRSLAHARVGVALYLRLTFLEPTGDRGPVLSKHPPDYMLVQERISFDKSGETDSVTCAWMVWYTTNDWRTRELPRGIQVHWRSSVPAEQQSLLETP